MQTVPMRYSDWKALQVKIGFKAFYSEYDLILTNLEKFNIYQIWGDNGSIKYTTQIFRGALPHSITSSYSQSQNDADKLDFESTYKTGANTRSVLEVKLT